MPLLFLIHSRPPHNLQPHRHFLHSPKHMHLHHRLPLMPVDPPYHRLQSHQRPVHNHHLIPFQKPGRHPHRLLLIQKPLQHPKILINNRRPTLPRPQDLCQLWNLFQSHIKFFDLLRLHEHISGKQKRLD